MEIFFSRVSLFSVTRRLARGGHRTHGYPGIVGLMFLESSFFPFPSEVVVPLQGTWPTRGR